MFVPTLFTVDENCVYMWCGNSVIWVSVLMQQWQRVMH